MRVFKAGDLVVCVKITDYGRITQSTHATNPKFTKGKTYKVLASTVLPCGIDEYDTFVDVVDDVGNSGFCFASRFIHLSEYQYGIRTKALKVLGI